MVIPNIFIHNEYPDFEIDEKKVFDNSIKIFSYIIQKSEIIENSCLSEYECESLTFDILFCDNKKIHEINLKYRQKDSPTDVISFAIFADSKNEERFIIDEDINLGEIIISLDKTKEQALQNNHSFENELYFLISHGILHLLGFDHLDEKTLDYMLKIQNEMIGVMNV